MSKPVLDDRPKSADRGIPAQRPAPLAAAFVFSEAKIIYEHGSLQILFKQLRKRVKVLLSVLAILIAVAWGFAAGKLPGTTPVAPKADPPAKQALAVTLVADKPNSLLVPEEVRKSLGICKG